jgi:hypothetical protein
MAKWADFSGPPPGAKALKAAGYTGVIRYIGLGSEGKQIHAAEYLDYVREGLDVLLVAELTISDAWAALDDYSTGVARAHLALADARAEGIPDSVPIAWAADSHATTSQVQDAIKYGRGFQAVLGARSGAYGFIETLRGVHAAGVASWYWLAGSKPSAADQAWINFWQHNDRTETVNRTVVDVNDGYAPMGRRPKPTPVYGKEDDTMFIQCDDRGSQAILSGGTLIYLDGTTAGPINDGTKFPRVQVTGEVYDAMVANTTALLSVPAKLDALLAKTGGAETPTAGTYAASGSITLTPEGH